VQESRINKAKFWAYDRKQFYIQLTEEILKIDRQSKIKNKDVAIRLNGTSDIDHIGLIKKYTGVDLLSVFFNNLKFYDYTKNINHIKRYLNTSYKITFSKSEANEIEVNEALNLGSNVAIVFSNELPATYKGKQVINGDLTDYRYSDPKNVIIGLKAKGSAKKDLSGFVVTSNIFKNQLFN
jgi:hypothetical protein